MMRTTKVEGEYSWVRYLRDRNLRLNKDSIIAMIGNTGSGKSESAVCIAMMCYFNWHEKDITNPTEEQVKQMIDWVNEFVIFKTDEIFAALAKNHPKNTWFVVEEVGISMDSQTWWDEEQRGVKHVFQTIRCKNYGMILTTPNLCFIQKSSRVLFPMLFEPVYIDRDLNKCIIAPRFKTYNNRDGKPLGELGLGVNYDECPDWINMWGIPRLPKVVRDAYESKKNVYVDNLARENANNMNKKEKDKTVSFMFCKNCDKKWIPRKDSVPAGCGFCRHKNKDGEPPVVVMITTDFIK